MPEIVRDENPREQIELAEMEGRADEAVPAMVRGNGRMAPKTVEDDDDCGNSPLRQSLTNGLSPRRFRQLIADTTRRYGSQTRLADDDAVGGGSVRGLNAGSHLTQFLAEKQRISLSRERRAARTMAVVMGAFVLCWLPFFLMYVTMSFCKSCERDTDPRVVNLIVWLGYVNSTLNPLIYTVFNVDFRRAFAALLQPKCRSAAL